MSAMPLEFVVQQLNIMPIVVTEKEGVRGKKSCSYPLKLMFLIFSMLKMSHKPNFTPHPYGSTGSPPLLLIFLITLMVAVPQLEKSKALLTSNLLYHASNPWRLQFYSDSIQSGIIEACKCSHKVWFCCIHIDDIL